MLLFHVDMTMPLHCCENLSLYRFSELPLFGSTSCILSHVCQEKLSTVYMTCLVEDSESSGLVSLGLCPVTFFFGDLIPYSFTVINCNCDFLNSNESLNLRVVLWTLDTSNVQRRIVTWKSGILESISPRTPFARF